MTIRQAALDLYKPPFRYEYGYVFDSNNQMVADKGEIGELKGMIATRVRGWGRIQYMDNPVGRAAQLQDEVGKIVAEALNFYWKIQEAPPEAQTPEERVAYAFGWFKALEAHRKDCNEPLPNLPV